MIELRVLFGGGGGRPHSRKALDFAIARSDAFDPARKLFPLMGSKLSTRLQTSLLVWNALLGLWLPPTTRTVRILRMQSRVETRAVTSTRQQQHTTTKTTATSLLHNLRYSWKHGVIDATRLLFLEGASFGRSFDRVLYRSEGLMIRLETLIELN